MSPSPRRSDKVLLTTNVTIGLVIASVIVGWNSGLNAQNGSKIDPKSDPKAAGKPVRRLSSAAQAPKFAPNRLIVKLKSMGEHRVEPSAVKLAMGQASQEEHEKYASIVELGQENGVKSVRGLFMKRAGVSTTDAKKSQDQMIEEIRTRFPGRSRRAPGGVPIAGSMPDLTSYYVFEFKAPVNIEKCRESFRQNPFVEFAEYDYVVSVQHVPNDPFFKSRGSWGQMEDDLWGLKKIQADKAWDVTKGEGVVVAVVDTGVDYKHPDLEANIWSNPKEIAGNGKDDDDNGFVDDIRGWDFFNNDNDPMDENLVGHGTHVAGTIAAVGDNGIGIVGVAPRAKVMPVRGMGPDGAAELSQLAPAMMYAITNGADVISNSWGPGNSWTFSPVLEDVVRMAHGLGVVVVFAAGNDSSPLSKQSPLNMRQPIKVAATFPDDTPADFSNWGVTIDVAAPGGSPRAPAPPKQANRSILSLRASCVLDGDPIVDQKYLRLSGTSMACPHVSGVAALVLANRPEFTNEDVRQVLRASADDVAAKGFDFRTGFGRINAAKALAIASPLRVRIDSPKDGHPLRPGAEVVQITGSVSGKALKHYQLSYSPLSELARREPLGGEFKKPANGFLYSWDVSMLPLGAYLLRLTATDAAGQVFEDAVVVTREPIGIVALANDKSEQKQAVVAGRNVFWIQTGTGSHADRIIHLDLLTGQRRQVGSFGNGRSADSIAAAGPWLAYTTTMTDADGGTVRLYDVRTDKDEQVAADFLGFKGGLAISAERIVYEATGGKIRLYDLSSRTTKTIAEDADTTPPNGGLAIDRERVVWSNGTDVFLMDLKTEKIQQLKSRKMGDPLFLTPSISGDDIVWQEFTQGIDSHIAHFDLATGKSRQIRQSRPSVFGRPSVSNGKVVWDDARNGNGDIYLYDLKENKEHVITAGVADQIDPAISGRRIIWRTLKRVVLPEGGQLIPDVNLFQLPEE